METVLIFCKFLNLTYSETIFICWTFNFIYFIGRTIHKFKIPTKYLFTEVVFKIIWNPQIQVSTSMSIVVKPRNLVPTKYNDFTVLRSAALVDCRLQEQKKTWAHSVVFCENICHMFKRLILSQRAIMWVPVSLHVNYFSTIALRAIQI